MHNPDATRNAPAGQREKLTLQGIQIKVCDEFASTTIAIVGGTSFRARTR